MWATLAWVVWWRTRGWGIAILLIAGSIGTRLPIYVPSLPQGTRALGVIILSLGLILALVALFRSAERPRPELGTHVFNQHTGRADMRGKQYLVDLSHEGARVIPTIDADAGRPRLDGFDSYVVKPKLGSDSVGLRFVDSVELERVDLSDGTTLVQPRIDFVHEVSLYFDQYSGRLIERRDQALQRMSAGDLVMKWIGPLHLGSFGGLGVKILWSALALSFPLLAVTGVIMWWRRV